LIPSIASAEQNNDGLKTLRCLNCKSEYPYESDIEFKIVHKGQNDLFVNFGIKIYTENKWKLLVDDVRKASVSNKIASYKFLPKGAATVRWDKHVMLPLEEAKKDGVSLTDDSPVVPYEITKGGDLMLFAWLVSPLPHGIHQPIHRFMLLPKQKD
jgi:hypothetical protein